MSVFHGARPQSSMSLRNSRELRTIAECIDALLAGDLPHLGDLLMQRPKAVQTAVVEGNWNVAQHLELIPTTGSNAVTQAELSAAQRTQLDQMRLQQGGKSGGKGSIRAPPRDSAREEDSLKQVLQLSVRGSRKGRWRSSHHTQAKVRSPVPVPTPKSPPPLQKARPRSSPARSSPSFRVAARKNMSRSPSAGGEARQVLPSAVSALRSPHVARQVAIRGSHSETPLDKRVSFRKSEERKILQRRSPWGERKKSQRGTSPSR